MEDDSSAIHFEDEVDNYWLDILLNHPGHKQQSDAFNFVCLNIMKILKKDAILQLDIEQFTNLLMSDTLAVTSEEIVFELTQRWLDFNNISPYDTLDTLFEVIRLPLIDPEYFVANVLPYAAPINNCMVYIQETLRWHLFPNQRDTIPKSRTTPRNSMKVKEVEENVVDEKEVDEIVVEEKVDEEKGVDEKEVDEKVVEEKVVEENIIEKPNRVLMAGSIDFQTSTSFELYDFNQDKWKSLKKLNLTKRNFAVALVENELLLIGGFDGRSTNSVHSVNLMNGSVSVASPLNEPRFNFWATVVGEGKSSVVYIAGGNGTGFGAVNGVESWDPVSRYWKKLAPMHTARELCGLTNLNGKLYAAGGIDRQTFYNSLEVYDISTGAWTMKAHMNFIRSFCTLAASDEYVYAVGGHSGIHGIGTAIRSVERYDPRTNAWMNLANISSAGIVGAVGIGSDIFVVGGLHSQNTELYDSKTGTWRKLGNLNKGRTQTTVIPLPSYLSNFTFDW